MARWIDDQGDGSDAVLQVEGEARWDCSPQLLRFLATSLDVGHLDIHHSVEGGDFALRDAQRPDLRATRDDLDGQIRALDRGKLPVEELPVEILDRGMLVVVMSNQATRPDPTSAFGAFLGVAAWSSPVTRIKPRMIAKIAFRIAVLPYSVRE